MYPLRTRGPFKASSNPAEGRTRNPRLAGQPRGWSQPDSNRRPSGCKPDALPTELWPPRTSLGRRRATLAARPWPTSSLSPQRGALADESDVVRAGGRGGRHHAASAGTAPAGRIHPRGRPGDVGAGLDVSGAEPSGLTPDQAEWADLVVTMGCGDECPHVHGTRYRDWNLPDPAGLPVEQVGAIRDEIAARVRACGSSIPIRNARAGQAWPRR
jgi:arsenate reductase